MIAKRVQVLVLMMALVYSTSAECSSPSRTTRELPSIWENIKTMPKDEIVSSVKAIFNPNAKNALDDKINEEVAIFLQHPDLDPLVIPRVHLNVTEGIFTLNGTLNGVNITGLSGIKIGRVHVNVLLLKAEFEFTLPSLGVRGNYNIDCLVDGVLPIFGKGPFEVNVTDAQASGSVKIGLKDGAVYIKSLDLDLSLGGLSVNVEHLMGDEEISNAVNSMINDMALGMLADNKVIIEKIVSKHLVEFVNSKMEGVSLKAILDAIAGEYGNLKDEITTQESSTSNDV